MPSRAVHTAAGIININLQLLFIMAGNSSVYNYLMIVASIFCLDDAFLRYFTPGFIRRRVERAVIRAYEKQSRRSRARRVVNFFTGTLTRFVVSAVLFAAVCYLSVPIIQVR